MPKSVNFRLLIPTSCIVFQTFALREQERQLYIENLTIYVFYIFLSVYRCGCKITNKIPFNKIFSLKGISNLSSCEK